LCACVPGGAKVGTLPRRSSLDGPALNYKKITPGKLVYHLYVDRWFQVCHSLLMRTKTLTKIFRLSEEEDVLLKGGANKRGISESAWIRQLIHIGSFLPVAHGIDSIKKRIKT